jgi:hypothetical protein
LPQLVQETTPILPGFRMVRLTFDCLIEEGEPRRMFSLLTRRDSQQVQGFRIARGGVQNPPIESLCLG